MYLLKVTEQNRFTVIAEVFEALIEGLRAFVYLRISYRKTCTSVLKGYLRCEGEAGGRTKAKKSCGEVKGCY